MQLNKFILLFSLLLTPFLNNAQTNRANKNLYFDLEALKEDEVFHDLSSAIKKPYKVRVLDLSNRALNTLPKEVSTFPNLECIDISYNQFTSLPEGLLQMDLKVLFINGNDIKSLPKKAKALKNTVIIASGNPITKEAQKLAYKSYKSLFFSKYTAFERIGLGIYPGLNLSLNEAINDSLNAISGIQSLEEQKCINNKLYEFTGIGRLIISNTSLCHSEKKLGNFIELSSLQIINSSINLSTVPFYKLLGLKELFFESTEIIGQLSSSLSCIEGLEYLHISNSEVSQEDLMDLQNNLPYLEIIVDKN
ncbi:hypothetical protein [Flammeovirga sp. SubArs3]|uniref:hypothetical protein n=1 Tax=Flammeovirga sp. SubArs3 TaxID=2995316 RepID=UPI00248A9CC9|nr:hypothetical protein [Flammeovirga sp. SubArs3]